MKKPQALETSRSPLGCCSTVHTRQQGQCLVAGGSGTKPPWCPNCSLIIHRVLLLPSLLKTQGSRGSSHECFEPWLGWGKQIRRVVPNAIFVSSFHQTTASIPFLLALQGKEWGGLHMASLLFQDSMKITVLELMR